MGRHLPLALALAPGTAGLFLAAGWLTSHAERRDLLVTQARVSAPPPAQEPLTLIACPRSGSETCEGVPARSESIDGGETAERLQEIELVGDPPPDPVEAGPCRLILEAVTDDDEAPLDAVAVELWRLGAPGNDEWCEGDQLQAVDTVRAGTASFADLPEGRYRIFGVGARKGSEDPPAFQVAGPATTVRITVAAPREVPVLLQVVSEQGVRLIVGARRRGGSSSAYTQPTPEWIQPRRLRDGCTYEPMSLHGRSCGRGRDEPAQPLTAGLSGFDMGQSLEATKACRPSRSVYLEAPGRSEVSVFATGDDEPRDGAYRFLGVSAPLDLLASRVVLPDGRRALEVGASVSASSGAVRATEELATDAWRTIPITVWVRLRGFRTLEFETDLDGPMPRWTLRPEGEPQEPEDDCCRDGLLARRGQEALEAAAAIR